MDASDAVGILPCGGVSKGNPRVCFKDRAIFVGRGRHPVIGRDGQPSARGLALTGRDTADTVDIVAVNGAPVTDLAFGTGLALAYVVLACLASAWVYRYAIRTGLIARYSAESVRRFRSLRQRGKLNPTATTALSNTHSPADVDEPGDRGRQRPYGGCGWSARPRIIRVPPVR